jgi:hypothetical protein
MHVAGRDGGKDNMADAMKRIVREEGTVGLYKGKRFPFFSILKATNQFPKASDLRSLRVF